MADNFFKIRNGISLGNLASDPLNPQNGDIYYNTARNVFRKYENGAWTDIASGQESTAQLIKGGTWSYAQSSGTLTWSANAFVQVLGIAENRNQINAGNVTLSADGQIAYVDINRVSGAPAVLTVNTGAASSIADQAGRFVIARRVGDDVLVANAFLLKNGEYLELDGAVAEITRKFSQLQIVAHESSTNKARVTSAYTSQLDSTTLIQELDTYVLNFDGAVINFSTGVVLESDDLTALGVNFTPFSVPVGEYFWYGIGLTSSSLDGFNRITAQVNVTQASGSHASASSAPHPTIVGSKKLGAVQVYNNGGSIEVFAIQKLGFGSESSTSGTTAGFAPVGSIIAYHSGYYTGAGNSGFTLSGPASNTVAGANAYLDPAWRVCDGSALNDAESPIFNGAGRYLPDITGARFIRGSTSMGSQSNPTYTPTGSVSAPTFTGNTAAYSGWFTTTTYTPAGSNSGGAASFNKTVMNTNQTAHSHALSANGYALIYSLDAGATDYIYARRITTSSWSSTTRSTITVHSTQVDTGHTNGAELGGTTDTDSVSWTSSTVNTSFTNPTFTGAGINPRTEFANSGNYTPTGSVSAPTFTGNAATVEPKYINALYIMRVK